MYKLALNIRRPKFVDIAEIQQLFLVTVTNSFKEEGIFYTLGHEIDMEVNALSNTLKRDFQTGGEEVYFLIATHQNKIVGTIAYGKVSELIIKNIPPQTTPIPEVKCVYVLPEFQNKGVGSFLLKHMWKVLHQNGIKAFYLDSGYTKAQQFWQKKLGNAAYTLENYWSGGSHHMIWQVELACI